MRIEKKQLVNDITNIIENSNFLYMISYKGLNVKQFDELRMSLDEVNAKCTILKNKLIKKAAELNNKDDLFNMEFSGDTALVSGKSDPGAVAKTISEFAKKHKQVSFKGGYLEGAVLSSEQAVSISKLPPREILLAQLLGTLQAPAASLARLLNAKLSGVVYALSAYKDKIS
ncbi:MAG: 50S ribosomal protein L10 [Victivallales bacterium]|nr:50S ribosomal protein L10 [Victivallales bacterium]MCF7889207.1 50S ribosomal protein L10 [Victivallales bacterium]